LACLRCMPNEALLPSPEVGSSGGFKYEMASKQQILVLQYTSVQPD